MIYVEFLKRDLVAVMRALGAKVKEGIRAAGGTPIELNTIAISDGITMGTSGMKTSLVSREVVADSIELVTLGHFFDAVHTLSSFQSSNYDVISSAALIQESCPVIAGGLDDHNSANVLPGHVGVVNE